jgi:hypothetical protein
MNKKKSQHRIKGKVHITNEAPEPDTDSIKAFARRRLKDPTYKEVIVQLGPVDPLGDTTAYQDIDIHGCNSRECLKAMITVLKEHGYSGNVVERRDDETRKAFKRRAIVELNRKLHGRSGREAMFIRNKVHVKKP